MKLMIIAKFFDKKMRLTAALDTRDVTPADRFEWTMRSINSENRVPIGSGRSIVLDGAQLPTRVTVVECQLLR